LSDPALGRTPDIIIQPIHGTIYNGEGLRAWRLTDDDTHVLLVAVNPSFEAGVVDDKVENKQVAPTILRARPRPRQAHRRPRGAYQASARFRPLSQTSDKTADRDPKSMAPGSIRAPFSCVSYWRSVALPRLVVVWRAQRLVRGFQPGSSPALANSLTRKAPYKETTLDEPLVVGESLPSV
jgi:hypothetical protein